MSFPSQENRWMRQAATYCDEDQVGPRAHQAIGDRQAAFLKRRADAAGAG